MGQWVAKPLAAMLQQRKFIAEASIPVRVRRPEAQAIMPARCNSAAKVMAGYPCPKMNVTLKAVKSLARYSSESDSDA